MFKFKLDVKYFHVSIKIKRSHRYLKNIPSELRKFAKDGIQILGENYKRGTVHRSLILGRNRYKTINRLFSHANRPVASSPQSLVEHRLL